MVSISLGITYEHLFEVYSHPSMNRLRIDGKPLLPIINPSAQYYSAFIGDEFVGAFLVITNTDEDKEIHILLLPKAVKKLRELCIMVIKETITHRITAKIIEGFSTIENLVKKLGFKYEGRIRQIITQKGQKKDVIMYGILKQEIGE